MQGNPCNVGGFRAPGNLLRLDPCSVKSTTGFALGGSGDSKHLISLAAPSRLPEMPGAPLFTGHGMVAVVELS